MRYNTAPEIPTLAVGETRNCAVSFVGVLDSGESLTGTPTIVEETTSDLTLTSKVVSTAALTINSKSVPLGKAVQFRVSGQLAAGSPYTIKITVGTTSTPAQTLVKYVEFNVDTE